VASVRKAPVSPGRVSAYAALAGVAAVGVALAVGELLGALSTRLVSPVTAVSQELVPLAPPALVAWAIDALGQANTVVLEAGTVVVALAIGAGTGVLARRSLTAAALVFAAFAAVGAVASLAQPGITSVGAVVGPAAAAAVGVLTLWVLERRLGEAPTDGASRAGVPTDPPLPRRSVLGLAAGLGAAAAVTAAGSRLLLSRYVGGTDPASVTLPAPARALGQVPAGATLEVDGLTPLLTPNDRFFRIDTALAVPRVDLDGWTLAVRGMVERELELTYDDLLAGRLVEVDSTLACVSNEVGGSLIGTARWLGVRLDELLERAGVDPRAGQVVGRSVDGFTAGFPVEAALDGRDALVAVGMNGEPLPARHGFPARLVVPGLFGYVSATKWLEAIEVTTWEGVDGYWVPRGWAKEAPLKTGSRIDVPRDGDARVAAGEVVVAGVAWAARSSVARVEVEVDGHWREAELSRPLSEDTWVQWRLVAALSEGDHTLRVRATDGQGNLQPQGPAPVQPDGAEGWHARRVRVG
jgi:DMSO/TMAO reductase YedYZ molybdopterin-dependent catalytic subunit